MKIYFGKIRIVINFLIYFLSLSIPLSAKTIGDYALIGCQSLKYATISIIFISLKKKFG